MNSENLLILVIIFFLLGCRVTCGNMKERFDTSVCVGDMGCAQNTIDNCYKNGFSSLANKARCKCGLKGGKKCANAKNNSNFVGFAAPVCPPCPACNSCCPNIGYATPRISSSSGGSKPLHQIWAESQGNAPLNIPVTQQPSNQVYRRVTVTQPIIRTNPSIYASNAGSYQVARLSGNAFGPTVQATDCSLSAPAVCYNPDCCATSKCEGVKVPTMGVACTR